MIWYLFYIGIYFAFMFGMGIYYMLKVKTYNDYLIGGWNMGFWSITGTSISTWTGAAVFVGWLGMGFSVGVSGYIKFALPGVLFSILLVYFFAAPLRRQKLYTLADLFGERFGGKGGILPSFISSLIIAVPGTALQLIAMSTVFNIAFGMGYGSSVFLSFVLILGFTVLGGLPATIVTDAIQSIVLFIGVLILFVASLFYAGGLGGIIASTPPEFISPTGPFGLTEVLLFALSVGPFYIISQTTWQRIFAAKSEEVAKKAGITGFLIAGVIAILPFSIGIAARQFVPADFNPDFLFSYVTSELLHPAIGGIVIVGLIAALVTSADSFILSGASNLTQDVYSRILNPNASDKNLLNASRIAVVIVSLLGLIIAFNLPSIVVLWQWAIRLAAATMLFPFLAVMFWKGVTKKGMIWSMVITGLVSLSWPFLGINIDQTFIGLAVSLLSLIIISLATKHDKTEQVKAVYWEDLDSANIDNPIIVDDPVDHVKKA
ncbi:sodium:solute symporter family protein [Siminovitchia acidinfaciens]|uniref:Sodium:solute symporter family protein n=1 Tax=Siminovitchia acidinfaciens TaxID=2321395 RepID=A0A429XZA9_9BACI|nr:sodium:solute symporter family protein [Siminovitchia acidinfaciens]RST74124.1 sodium:solute symporter family protein [Siminovitchia acidinfaciens]